MDSVKKRSEIKYMSYSKTVRGERVDLQSEVEVFGKQGGSRWIERREVEITIMHVISMNHIPPK